MLDASATSLTQRRSHNSSLCIHKLSVEVLEKIFWHTLRDGKIWATPDIPLDYFSKLRRLRAVCNQWFDIISGSPRLWALADAEHSQEDWEAAFKNSKSHPLTLNSSRGIAADRGVLIRFARAAFQHVGRWQQVSLSIPKEEDFSSLTRPAPLLEKLELSAYPSYLLVDSPHLVIDLFGGYAPRLCDLSLSGISLENWHVGFLRGLRLLALEHLPPTATGASPNLGDVLLGCEDLEVLNLNDVQLTFTTTTDPIALPNLRELHLSNVAPDIIRYVGNTIQAPQCRTYEFRPNHRDLTLFPNVAHLLEAAATPLYTRAPRNTFRPMVSIILGGYDEIDLEGSVLGSKVYTFSFNLHSAASSRDVMRWFHKLNSSLSSERRPMETSLHFKGFDALGVDGTLDTLERLDWTNNLTFYDPAEGLDLILQRLESKGNDKEWLCPNLTRLVLHDCRYSDASIVVDMVLARTKASDSQSSARPRRFQALRIEGDCKMDEESFVKMKVALGRTFMGDVVSWDPTM